MPPKKRKATPEAKGSSVAQEAPFKRPNNPDGVAGGVVQEAPSKRPASSLEGAVESVVREVLLKRPASSLEGAAESITQEVPFKRPASDSVGAAGSLSQEPLLEQLAFGSDGVTRPASVNIVTQDAPPEQPAVAFEETPSKQPAIALKGARDGTAQAAASGPGIASEGATDSTAPAAASAGAADTAAQDSPSGPPQGAALELTSALRESGWRAALQSEFAKPYFKEMAEFVAKERSLHTVYPPPDKVFEAFNLTPLSELKVVLLGQDPYHEPGQAHGLCFSVPLGIPPPPSLKNIYKELTVDVPGFCAPGHGLLEPWALRGVLLLNATLTVRRGHKEANSHAKCGWQRFTDAVISVINKKHEGVVFLLWGGFAQKKGKLVDRARHRVIETAHPSPLSARKWHGCKTFSKCNKALQALGRTEIEWRLDGGSGGQEEKQTKLSMLKGSSGRGVDKQLAVPEGGRGDVEGQTTLEAPEGSAGAVGDEQTKLSMLKENSGGGVDKPLVVPEGDSGGGAEGLTTLTVAEGGSVGAGDEQTKLGGSGTLDGEQTELTLPEGASGGDEQTKLLLPQGGSCGAGDEQTKLDGDSGTLEDEQTELTLPEGSSGGAGGQQTKLLLPPDGSGGAADEQTKLGGGSGADETEQTELIRPKEDRQLKLVVPKAGLDRSGKKQTKLKFA